jgi:hypothetical protein
MKDASTTSAASVELQNVFASSSIFSFSRRARAADAGSAFVSLHALEDDIDVGALSGPPMNEDTCARHPFRRSSRWSHARRAHGDDRERTIIETILRFVRQCDARWERLHAFIVGTRWPILRRGIGCGRSARRGMSFVFETFRRCH